MSKDSKTEKFHFKGTADEVVATRNVAKEIGFKPQVSDNGVYYVTPEEGAILRLYLFYKNIVGWWHYFNTNEYFAMMAS